MGDAWEDEGFGGDDDWAASESIESDLEDEEDELDDDELEDEEDDEPELGS
jgi:hypothetical protein